VLRSFHLFSSVGLLSAATALLVTTSSPSSAQPARAEALVEPALAELPAGVDGAVAEPALLLQEAWDATPESTSSVAIAPVVYPVSAGMWNDGRVFRFSDNPCLDSYVDSKAVSDEFVAQTYTPFAAYLLQRMDPIRILGGNAQFAVGSVDTRPMQDDGDAGGIDPIAVVYTPNDILPLPTPPGFHSVAWQHSTTLDVVVGELIDGAGDRTAVLWKPDGTLVYLNDLLPVKSGWDLDVAFDIDGDVVMGVGRFHGVSHLYYLSLDTLALVPGLYENCNGDPLKAALCSNGDFEVSNFNDWQGDVGSYSASGTGYSNPTGAIAWNGDHNGTGQHVVVYAGDGDDPILQQHGISLPRVAGGSFAARVGNHGGGKRAARLYRTITVTPANAQFRFRFATVLEDPSGHTDAERPFFGVSVYTGAAIHPSQRVDALSEKWIADGSDPLFYEVAGEDILYTPWRCHLIDLSDYIGQQVTIVYETADCTLGAHWGYAYIDDACDDGAASAMSPSFTLTPPSCGTTGSVIVDGSASTGTINYHYWSVQSVDAAGNGTGIYQSQWFQGQPGPMNLSNFFADHGQQFQCGEYYRVKLATQNECNPWEETTQTFYYECPAPDVGPDQWICAGDSTTLTSSGYQSHWNMSWVDDNGTQVGTGASVTVSPTTTTTYTAHAEDTNNGMCAGWEDVTVTVVQDNAIGIGWQDTCDCAGTYRLHAHIFGGVPPGTPVTYAWSNGSTTDEALVDGTTAATYTLTVTTPCGTKTTTHTVSPRLPAQYAVANAFTPNNDGINDFLRPIQFSGGSVVPWGHMPAYETGVRFRVYNRWGNLVHDQTASCANGPHAHGDVAWDGNFNGVPQPTEVYLYILEKIDCNGITTEAVRGEATLLR